MPVEGQEKILAAVSTLESRKIKIGKKGKRKFADAFENGMKITFAERKHKSEDFKVDLQAMQACWEFYGNEGAAPKELQRIPVRLLSDNITDNIYIYRGWWAASGPRCTSRLGDKMARRKIDTKAYEKNKKIVVLDNPVSHPCDKSCPMWTDPGEKSDCGWSLILSVQIECLPVIPNLARFRSTSPQSRSNLVGSLNQIKDITGGILAGIPLDLIWKKKTGPDHTGKTRSYPVLGFEFRGTSQQLREHAIVELESRRRLAAAIGGEEVTSSLPTAPASMPIIPSGGYGDEVIGEDEVDDEFIPDDDGPSTPEPKSKEEAEAEDLDRKIIGKISDRKRQLGMTDKALELLLDKHDGDYSAALEEMGDMVPESDFSPGQVSSDEDFIAEEEEEEQEDAIPQQGEAVSEDDDPPVEPEGAEDDPLEDNDWIFND
jgi:hypothetical protein